MRARGVDWLEHGRLPGESPGNRTPTARQTAGTATAGGRTARAALVTRNQDADPRPVCDLCAVYPAAASTEPAASSADARDRGIVVHEVLERFVKASVPPRRGPRRAPVACKLPATFWPSRRRSPRRGLLVGQAGPRGRFFSGSRQQHGGAFGGGKAGRVAAGEFPFSLCLAHRTGLTGCQMVGCI